MPKLSFSDVRLNYDPSAPQQRFRDAGLEAAFAKPSAQLPSAPPWPAGGAPQPISLTPIPTPSDDLSRFQGYDAVVVTWTAAEAAALAALFTPAHPISAWYEYRHGVAAYLPLVTGAKSPFNDQSREMARYYHSLGLYFPCQIGNAKVLLFKSGLHFAYDGPATPVKKLMTEIAQAVSPKVFITTGTAGAIGANVLLGDVVVGGSVRFDCTTPIQERTVAQRSLYPFTAPARCVERNDPRRYFSSMHRVCPTREALRRYGAPQPMQS